MKGIKIRSIAKSRSVYELLGHPIRWIRGQLYGQRLASYGMFDDADLARCGFKPRATLDEKVDCFCLIGAAQKAYPKVAERHAAIRRLAKAIAQHDPHANVQTDGRIGAITDSVITWNDDLNRRWQEVRTVAKLAHV